MLICAFRVAKIKNAEMIGAEEAAELAAKESTYVIHRGNVSSVFLLHIAELMGLQEHIDVEKNQIKCIRII